MMKLLTVTGLAMVLLLSIGCDHDKITARDVHADMSPELSTTGRTPGEVDTQLSKTVDMNGRSAWDDLLSFLLLDRPSRLNIYPVP